MAESLDDSKYRAFIEGYLRLIKASEELPIEEGRKLSRQFFLTEDAVREPVHRIEDVEIRGGDQNRLPLRIYIPSDLEGLPIVLFFHRGGWSYGSIEETDPLCRKLANHMGCTIVCPEYRLAPEYPFPKALEDCYSALQWMERNAGDFGGDSLIVGGESAGANLAAAVSLMARDKGGPALAAELLICPVVSASIEDGCFERCADRFFLTKEIMDYYWDLYAQSPEDERNPYAVPELANDFAKLPPALVVTAEYDPLRESGESYAARLQQAGVPVVLKRFGKVIHGFIDLPIYDEEQKVAWISEIGKLLSQVIKRKTSGHQW